MMFFLFCGRCIIAELYFIPAITGMFFEIWLCELCAAEHAEGVVIFSTFYFTLGKKSVKIVSRKDFVIY